MEAVYLGLVFVGLAWTAGARGTSLLVRIGGVAGFGALVALPWWIRNFVVFGSPMPGQLADNAFLARNEQIFAWHDTPTLAGFIAQGPGRLVTNVGYGAWHNFIDVLLVPGMFIVLVGLVTLILGWRSQRGRFAASPLQALLVYGAVVFLVSSVIFPVATTWGTFEHASGPLVIALVVLAALGGDAFVARLRAWRNWPRPNAGMAPAALTALVVTMTVLQLNSAGQQADARKREIATVAEYLRNQDTPDSPAPIITNRPIWLADALDRPTLALPDESAASVLDLANTFGARLVAIIDPDGRDMSGVPNTCFIDASPRSQLSASFFLDAYTIAEACR